MSVIAQDVFTMAMDLMDETSQDGTYNGYPEEYKKKAWSILTILSIELLSPSITPIPVTSPQNALQVDDRTALNTLPYGLAAHLIMEEDQNRAAFFNARYDELKRKRKATVSKIKDVYGIVESEDTTTSPDPGGGSGLDDTWEKLDTSWG